MAEAKFSIGQVNITNNLRVIAREVAAPTIEVYNHIYLAPHSTTRNIVITGLKSTTHYFDFYETTATSGSSPIGTLLATFTIDVGLINQSTIELLEFIVGGVDAPANGDTDYINAILDGIDTSKIEVMQRSVGIRSWTDEIDVLAGGGFSLLGGELFNQDDRWFIKIIHDVTTTAPTGTNVLYEGVKLESADFTIDATYNNNLIMLSGGTGWITGVIADLTAIPNFTKFTFNNQDGTATGLILDVHIGDIAAINGISDTKFYLRKYEVVTFMVYDGVLFLIDGKGNWDKIGQQVILDTEIGVDIDVYTAKENGQWVNITDEPRLFYWYVNRLPIGYLAATSTTELGKWFIDMPNNRFRMPKADNNDLQLNLSLPVSPGTSTSLQSNASAPLTQLLPIKNVFYNRVL